MEPVDHGQSETTEALKPGLAAADLLDLAQANGDPDIVWNYVFPKKIMDRLVKGLPCPETMQPWLKEQLNQTATSFVHWVLRSPERLSRPKARDQLLKVEKRARELLSALEGLHPDPAMLLNFALRGAYRNPNGETKLGLYEAHHAVIKTLMEQASLAANQSPLNKSGPEKAFDIGFTVRAVMSIYIRVTGEEPTFFYGLSADGKKDVPASPISTFIRLYFSLLPTARLARLPRVGRIPQGPPKTVAAAMALAKIDAASLNSAPNQILRYELHKFKEKQLSPLANSG